MARRRCSVGQAIEAMGQADFANLRQWFEVETDKRTWAMLHDRGYDVSLQMVGRHRRAEGECGCSQ
jgi:hypothetical protein